MVKLQQSFAWMDGQAQTHAGIAFLSWLQLLHAASSLEMLSLLQY